eukprot:1565250-Rhodomonas_salina.2
MFVLRKDCVVLTNICSSLPARNLVLPQQHSTRSGSKIRIPPKLLVPKFENNRRQTYYIMITVGYFCPGHWHRRRRRFESDHKVQFSVDRKCRTYTGMWTNIWTYICSPTIFPDIPSTSSSCPDAQDEAAVRHLHIAANPTFDLSLDFETSNVQA